MIQKYIQQMAEFVTAFFPEICRVCERARTVFVFLFMNRRPHRNDLVKILQNIALILALFIVTRNNQNKVHIRNIQNGEASALAVCRSEYDVYALRCAQCYSESEVIRTNK